MSDTINIAQCDDKKRITAALRRAFQAATLTDTHHPICGCGRVYVDLGRIRKGSKLSCIIASYGRPMTRRPYCGTQRFLYVGYDNATGHQWGMGEAFAASMRASGFNATVLADPD